MEKIKSSKEFLALGKGESIEETSLNGHWGGSGRSTRALAEHWGQGTPT